MKKKKFDKNSFILSFILFLIVVLGIFVRIKCFLVNPSLWHDECALAWNVLHKNYAQLFGQLRFSQVAPPLFLISAKGLLDICKFGNNILYTDMALVSIPFLSGILSFLAFFFVSKEVLEKKTSQIGAMLLFATNYRLLMYSCQFKQYSTDVLF